MPEDGYAWTRVPDETVLPGPEIQQIHSVICWGRILIAVGDGAGGSARPRGEAIPSASGDLPAPSLERPLPHPTPTARLNSSIRRSISGTWPWMASHQPGAHRASNSAEVLPCCSTQVKYFRLWTRLRSQ